ncbi:MAG: hypothetical protein A2352_04710 [Caulobacterales bacterium RIFOXYB1_FULL_67_16]|nr:MAG: hypothetical protein A2352_04710 [Caulobacterales bacterium RIFOXYB1_FULL_67_16]
MAKRLKVFTWSDGFHAFTVAVGSRPKALAAWGSKQDLFATGLASELSGGPDYEAALAAPGEVIERGLAIDVGKIGKAAKPKTPAGPTKAQIRKRETLEADRERLDADHKARLSALDRRRAALEQEQARMERTYEARRERLTQALKALKA